MLEVLSNATFFQEGNLFGSADSVIESCSTVYLYLVPYTLVPLVGVEDA